MVKSLAKTSEKWKRRVRESSQDYEDGVKNPTKDWESQAIAGKDRYVAGIQDSISKGSREDGIRARGQSDYIAKTVAKANRWGQGVSQAGDEFSSAMSSVLAHEEALQRTILAMPNATEQDREARMLAWSRGMREFKN